MTFAGSRRPAVALVALLAWSVATSAGGTEPPRDVDDWHRALEAAVGVGLVDEPAEGWTLGLYPTLGVAAGPPNWLAYQLNGSVSLSRNGHLSVFAGYGYERGPTSRSHMVTVGWGGVQRLQAGRSQRGFYGKFLRYRRMEVFDHGLHHGISVGHESGAGAMALSVELGAARSAADHWSFIGQISLKLAFPVALSLSRSPETRPAP